MRLSFTHKWNVKPAEARGIQERLRKKWQGRDQIGTLRTVAGLDAAFVLKGSQALADRQASRSNALRDANRAIGAVVVFSYPQMEELERAHAELPLEFPYVP